MPAKITKPRLAYIDIAKGFAMLCIIAGHFGIVTVNRFVYTFHVPLFFLISGYFLSTKLDTKSFTKKKIRQLIVPYYLTGLAIIAFASVINTILGANIQAVLDDSISIFGALLYGAGTPHTDPFVIRQIGLLWFLWALFFALVITRLAISFKRPGLIVSIAALLGVLSSRFVWLPLSIQAGMFASLFVYLGYYAKQKDILSRTPSPTLVIGLTLLWAFCIANQITIGVVSCRLGDNLITSAVCLIDSLGSSYLIVLLCKSVECHIRPIAKFLNVIGQATLVIMCFHAISDFTFPNYLLYQSLSQVGFISPVQHIIVVSINTAWALLGLAITMKTPALKKLFQIRKLNPLPSGQQPRPKKMNVD